MIAAISPADINYEETLSTLRSVDLHVYSLVTLPHHHHRRLPGDPTSELPGVHSVTCHPTQVNAPRLTPAMQASTRFTYPGGIEG